MPTYKYSALMPDLVTVFGMHEAKDREALEQFLSLRRLKLVDAQELTLHQSLGKEQPELPRLLQLRIGERLREAILSGMPTQDAIRAVAAEPFEHPVIMLMPWALLLAMFVSVVLLLVAVMSPPIRVYAAVAATVPPALILLISLTVTQILIKRPRKALLRLADQIERGQLPRLQVFEQMSGDLGTVARSELPDQSKATSLADLVPTATSSNLRSHQFAAQMVGPLLVMCLLIWGIHGVCLTIVPQFRDIFAGFGVQLPWVTSSVFFLSSIIEYFGFSGLFLSIAVLGALLCLLYSVLASARWSELIGSIPWIGYSARWLLQARIARLLGVLLRNNAEPAMALQIATKSAGSKTMRQDGERLAAMVQEGLREQAFSPSLSGLPISLLFDVPESDDRQNKRLKASHAMSLYAEALEQAASGSGTFFTAVVEMFAVLAVGVLLGFVVVALLLPLLQLMNDLA